VAPARGRPPAPSCQRGLTLIELLIALTVAVVLLGIGIPGFDAVADKRGLKGASQSVFRDLRFARSEALKRNRPITLSFAWTSDTQWCYGVVQGLDPCDCTADDCVVDGVRRVRSAAEMARVRMPAAPSFFPGGVQRTTFRPNHGTAGNGTVRLVSDNGVEARVILSRLGRVRMCSPDPGAYGLEECP
jgi:prepilin-type N-terminal cleavage/methylation domain-containing protein